MRDQFDRSSRKGGDKRCVNPEQVTEAIEATDITADVDVPFARADVDVPFARADAVHSHGGSSPDKRDWRSWKSTETN